MNLGTAVGRLIALTLRDLDDGQVVLWGREIRFDSRTGRRLDPPLRTFENDLDVPAPTHAPGLSRQRRRLPQGWRELCARQGWIELASAPSPAVRARWRVTDAGREEMRRWL